VYLGKIFHFLATNCKRFEFAPGGLVRIPADVRSCFPSSQLWNVDITSPDLEIRAGK
jgi:hypothetical protein